MNTWVSLVLCFLPSLLFSFGKNMFALRLVLAVLFLRWKAGALVINSVDCVRNNCETNVCF